MNSKPAIKISVMLIDDNDTDNFVNKKIVEMSGCTDIIIHNSGQGALEYFDLYKNNTIQIPDLLFLDLNMPIVNGFAFLSAFENMTEEVKNKCKIIILTSSDNKMDIDQVLDNGYVIDYITKPLSVDKVKTIINQIKIDDLIPD